MLDDDGSRLYLDDLWVGRTLEIGSYALERDEVVEFARRWDPQPFHIDEAAARRSMFGGLTASSLHLFAICTRLFFDHREPIAVLAMLGKDAVRFPHPARPGDTLRYVTECVEQRVSRSRPDRGIVTLADRLSDSADAAVLEQRVSLLVARRPDPGAAAG